MSFAGILLYVGRAMALAVPLTLVLYAARRLVFQKKAGSRRREILVFLFMLYGTVLMSVTAIRDGTHLLDWWKIPHTGESIQLVPIFVTLKQGRAGAWYLIYPVVGNIAWFVPFGFFLGRLRPGYGVGRMALYSGLLSVGIEILQWVLLSGISDIDDVIFNVIGGVLGWALSKIASSEGSCREKRD